MGRYADKKREPFFFFRMRDHVQSSRPEKGNTLAALYVHETYLDLCWLHPFIFRADLDLTSTFYFDICQLL